MQVVEKGGVHAKEEGTRQKSCGPDRPRGWRFLRKSTKSVENPRGGLRKNTRNLKKKSEGEVYEKTQEILRNLRGSSTKKHKKP